MTRHEFQLIKWCETAISQIKYPPDRRAVMAELKDHIFDRYETFITQGLTEDEALKCTIDAMGDPWITAKQLASVHRPFWGYLLRTCKILLVILLILCIKPVWDYTKNLDLQEEPNVWAFDVFSTESYGGDTGWTLLHLSQPDLSFSSDISRFTITDAALIKRANEDDSKNDPHLHIRMEQVSLLPWKEHEEYFPVAYSIKGIGAWFTATDSMGNIYPASDNSSENNVCMYVVGEQSGILSYTYDLWINNFPEDAQWVDICYERDGRSYELRVYLTGGVGA